MSPPTHISSFLASGSKYSSLCFSEWLALLGGPADPPFNEAVNFKNEWGRLTRLGVVVLVLLGAIWGISYSFSNIKPTSPAFLWVLLGGAVLGIIYRTIFATIFRVKASLYDTFFVLLLLGLPWVPIIETVRAIGNRYSGNPLVGFPLTITLYVIFFSCLWNISRGLAYVSRCPPWRALLSLLFPVALVIYLILRVKPQN
jgi:hypothetical protein